MDFEASGGHLPFAWEKFQIDHRVSLQIDMCHRLDNEMIND